MPHKLPNDLSTTCFINFVGHCRKHLPFELFYVSSMTPVEQENKIRWLITKICVENIYNFPNVSIISLRINPPDTQVVCDEVFWKRKSCDKIVVFTPLQLHIHFMSLCSFAVFKTLFRHSNSCFFMINSSKHDSRKCWKIPPTGIICKKIWKFTKLREKGNRKWNLYDF